MPLVVGILNNLLHILLVVTSTQHTAPVTHHSALSTQNSELRTLLSTITTLDFYQLYHSSHQFVASILGIPLVVEILVYL